MVNMYLHQTLQLQQFLLKHLCNCMLHFYHSLRILLRKYQDKLFLLQLLFQRLYFSLKNLLLLSFVLPYLRYQICYIIFTNHCITYSLRWLNYSIFHIYCQKSFFIVVQLQFCIFKAFMVFASCTLQIYYILITFLYFAIYLLFSYNIFNFPFVPIPFIPSFPSLR